MKHTNFSRGHSGSGFTLLEFLASISVLTIMISVFTTLSVRINQLAKETQNELTTIHELANLLELELERLPHQALGLPATSNPSTAVQFNNLDNHPTDQITLNSILKLLWPKGRLLVHRNDDGIGTKVTLTFIKNIEQPDALPLSLSGWAITSKPTKESELQVAEPSSAGDTL